MKQQSKSTKWKSRKKKKYCIYAKNEVIGRELNTAPNYTVEATLLGRSWKNDKILHVAIREAPFSKIGGVMGS